MTYEDRLEQHERETARIAEIQLRLYKWAGAFTVALVACFGYAALTIFKPALPASITFILFGLVGVCAIKAIALRDELVAAKRRQQRDMMIVAPSRGDHEDLVRGRYTVSTEHP